MILFVLIIAMVLLVAIATAAHCLKNSYWPAVRFTLALSAVCLLLYFLGFWIIFFNPTTFDWTEPFRLILIALAGSLLGGAMSMLIGLIFIADRRIVKRRNARSRDCDKSA